ncbi:MAG: CPBP family intramembrane metalloprotease [Candidatus Thorarchaeota archaeon]|nr:CPBP family intramembrane metalloprotease [Candidatus Thorarchaeota archaeon]
MAIDDPDAFEIEDMDEIGIGIFEPGVHIERYMDWNRFSHVLYRVISGWVMMFVLTIIIMVPLIGIVGIWGLITNPWALLILTLAEFGFIIPVYRYVKKEGISFKSIGLKNMLSVKDIALGVVVGFLMLAANLVISYFMYQFNPGLGGDELFFFPPDGEIEKLIWVSLWTVAMFAIVGFSEEIVFRGFLQRRMEMYYREKGSQNYKTLALVITSFIFAAIHLDLIGLGTRFVLGLFLGYLAQKRNYSIIGPTVAHGINNSAIVIMALLFT